MFWKLSIFGLAALGIAVLLSIKWSQPGYPNLVMPTMGGQQVWTDMYYHVGWRIQRNVFTGHHRLLDPEDRRHAWGTFEDCFSHFGDIRTKQEISYSGKPLAVIVKGLGGMEVDFRNLKNALMADGFHVAYIAYPSTRQGIAEHAGDITLLLNRLEEVVDIAFIAHSMGGLVLRQVLADGGPWVAGKKIRGLVMIGTPNQGVQLAERFSENGAFVFATTAAGQDLRPKNVAKLPPVNFRHCLVVGSNNGGEGLNPLIDGDDDGIVAVAEAMIPGSDDVLFIEGYHHRLPAYPGAIAGVLRFINGQRCDGH